MRVFSYIRVSGLGQVDKDGPVRQRESIAAFCAKHNLTIVNEFSEDGVSGTVEAMDRPQFAEMMLKIDTFKRGLEEDGDLRAVIFNPEAIVVERMDRLARDLMISEFLLAECRKRNIKVFCSDQSELTDMASNEGDPTRVMLRQILGAIAQWDKSVTVKKLKAARTRIRSTGALCEGKKPYGFGHKPEEVGVKKIIRDMHADLSFTEIARYLNAGGYKTRHGKPWNKSNVFTVFSERRRTRKEKVI